MPSIHAISDSKKINELEKKYYQTENESDYFKIFSHYVQSSNGTSRLFKLLTDFCRWPLHFASSLNISVNSIKKLLDLQNRFKFLSKSMIIAKFPNTLIDLNNSLKAYQHANIENVTRLRDKVALRITQTVSDGGFLIQLGELLSLYSLGGISSVVNLASNLFYLFYYCISLKMGSEDYLEHNRMQKIVDSQKNPIKRLQSIFHEIKNLDLLNIAKSVSAIALTVFFISNILFETTIISAGSLLLLSTCSTVFAIWSYFYKESMTFPLEN